MEILIQVFTLIYGKLQMISYEIYCLVYIIENSYQSNGS